MIYGEDSRQITQIIPNMIIGGYVYIRNYSYLEYAGIQSCPLIGKKGT